MPSCQRARVSIRGPKRSQRPRVVRWSAAAHNTAAQTRIRLAVSRGKYPPFTYRRSLPQGTLNLRSYGQSHPSAGAIRGKSSIVAPPSRQALVFGPSQLPTALISAAGDRVRKREARVIAGQRFEVQLTNGPVAIRLRLFAPRTRSERSLESFRVSRRDVHGLLSKLFVGRQYWSINRPNNRYASANRLCNNTKLMSVPCTLAHGQCGRRFDSLQPEVLIY
jgi:hypothetical protein